MLGSVKDWVANLFFAHMQATTGIAMTDQGIQMTLPNPAALWPPHRRPGTPAKRRRGSHRTKLVGAKGLR